MQVAVEPRAKLRVHAKSFAMQEEETFASGDIGDLESRERVVPQFFISRKKRFLPTRSDTCFRSVHLVVVLFSLPVIEERLMTEAYAIRLD